MSSSRLTAQELRIVVTIAGAGRGTCNRLRTCTTLWTKHNKPISSGYNGSLPGDPHCDGDEGHLIVNGHCLRTLHGETNAILNADDLIGRFEGGIATILGSPCLRCATMLAFYNPASFEFIGDHDNKEKGGELVRELCERRNIELVFIKTDDALNVFQGLFTFLQGPGGPFKDISSITLTRT